MWLALGALLAVACVLLVARPFLRGPHPYDDRLDEPAAPERKRVALAEERDRVLAALKELEFDHRTGKVSDEDYRAQVGPLRRRAAEALRALDPERPRAPVRGLYAAHEEATKAALAGPISAKEDEMQQTTAGPTQQIQRAQLQVQPTQIEPPAPVPEPYPEPSPPPQPVPIPEPTPEPSEPPGPTRVPEPSPVPSPPPPQAE